MRPPRDPNLLDLMEDRPTITIQRAVWRMVRDGRDPLQCSMPLGRWDDGSFDVLYTSFERNGAISEIYYHLKQGQPVFPSGARYRLYEIPLNINNVLDITGSDFLKELSVDMSIYGKMPYSNRELEYRRTQVIGEAASFHEYSAIQVPCARQECSNLVLNCGQISPDAFEEPIDHEIVDLRNWAP